MLTEWCGDRKGRRRDKGEPGPAPPATLCRTETSSASSGMSGGSRPGSRIASMVLPAPGSPESNRWCPPAAAISSARLAALAPDLIQIRQPLLVQADADVTPGRTRPPVPSRNARTALRSRAPSELTSGTPATSSTFSRGTINVSRSASVRHLEGHRESAPHGADRAVQTELADEGRTIRVYRSGIRPVPASTPTRIGRSKVRTVFGISAGARFTVILRPGNPKPETRGRGPNPFDRVPRGRRGARPLVRIPGVPRRTVVSTRTRIGSTPTSANVWTTRNTHRHATRTSTSSQSRSGPCRRERMLGLRVRAVANHRPQPRMRPEQISRP